MKKRGRLSAQGLDEEVVEAFRMYVMERYGKLHTVFGQELQKAMEEYLGNANTHTHALNTQLRKTVEEKTELVEEVIQTAGLLNAINNGGSVRPNAIKKILGESVGIDPRTINNYYNAFCRKHELITNLNGELARV